MIKDDVANMSTRELKQAVMVMEREQTFSEQGELKKVLTAVNQGEVTGITSERDELKNRHQVSKRLST